jgi:23S rRNA pseudouridine1911/1915/1917 synthase
VQEPTTTVPVNDWPHAHGVEGSEPILKKIMEQPASFVLPPDTLEDRADKVLADFLPDKPSRSIAAKLLREGRILVDGRAVKPSAVVGPGRSIQVLPPPRVAESIALPAPIHFRIIFEDDHLIVLDKPAGLVVHPGAGRPSGTLVDELIKTRPAMLGVGEEGRWGVVHRLDRDTSGVMVVAKTAEAHADLSLQFKEHSVHRIYKALVRGSPGFDEGVINAPLGRHAKERKRISTATAKGRRAVTRWKVAERLGSLTLLAIAPETGRTHQIRVHLAYVGLPVAGDTVYGKARKTSGALEPVLTRVLKVLKRQGLHAEVLGFVHPVSRECLEFSSPLAPDMEESVRIARLFLSWGSLKRSDGKNRTF